MVQRWTLGSTESPGGSLGSSCFGARYLLPTGMASARPAAVVAQGSGDVGERGGPCPVFRAR